MTLTGVPAFRQGTRRSCFRDFTKFCVCREYSGMGMTKIVTAALREECRKRSIQYIRLDTALDEKTIRKLDSGIDKQGISPV